jgi:hypothetical protein
MQLGTTLGTEWGELASGCSLVEQVQSFFMGQSRIEKSRKIPLQIGPTGLAHSELKCDTPIRC